MEKRFIVYWSARGNTVVSGKNKKDAVENNDLFAEDVEVKDFKIMDVQEYKKEFRVFNDRTV